LDEAEREARTDAHDSRCSAPTNERGERTETVELSQQQRLRIAELPDDFRAAGVDGRAVLVRKPTGQILRIQKNGGLIAATIVAKRRLADRRADQAGHLVASS
jgi:hypothetical protein